MTSVISSSKRRGEEGCKVSGKFKKLCNCSPATREGGEYHSSHCKAVGAQGEKSSDDQKKVPKGRSLSLMIKGLEIAAQRAGTENGILNPKTPSNKTVPKGVAVWLSRKLQGLSKRDLGGVLKIY